MDFSINQYFSSLRSLLGSRRFDDEEDDFLFDDFAELMDDEADDFAFRAKKVYLETIPQGLNSPLLSTTATKLRCALEGRSSDPAIRASASFKQEERWVAAVRKRCPSATMVVGDEETSARVILSSWRKGALSPARLPSTRVARKLIRTRRQVFRDIEFDGRALQGVRVREAYGSFRPFELALNERRRVSDASSGTEIVSCSLFDGKVHLGPKFCAFEFDGVVTLCGIDVFVCIHDALQRRVKLFVADCVLGRSEECGIDICDVALEVGMWQLDMVLACGDVVYDVAKAPEAVFKTWASYLRERSWARESPYERMIGKYKEKLADLGKETHWMDRLDAIVRRVVSYEAAVELSPMIRLAGHPTIDPSTSAAKSRRLATAPDRTRPSQVYESGYLFNHLVLKEYVRINGRWPPILFRPGTHTTLEKLHRSAWLNVTDQSYPLDDWFHAEMQQIEEFDYHENYLHLFKDKSCSPGRAALADFYNSVPGLERDLRRLLLQMLDAPVIDTRALMHQWSTTGLSDDDKMILLYPKECEFKKQGRMFCMLTIRARLCFSIIQENVKAKLLKYLPFTSMTMGQAQLRSTLRELSRKKEHERTFFLELDLSSWNLLFRHFWSRHVGEMADVLCGVLGMFGRAHEFFAESEIAVLAGDARIEQLEDGTRGMRSTDNMWYGHKGGFEGIDQAFWTLLTILMAYLCLKEEPCSFMLLGQGDNQTLAITWDASDPRDDEDIIDYVAKKFEATCSDFNHVAKPEEFIESTVQITYSKDYYLEGQHVPKVLHLASQAGPRTTEDVSTFSASMGAIYSSHITAGSNAPCPGRLWDLSVLWGEIFVRDGIAGVGPYQKITKDLSDDEIELSLVMPSCLGGLPVSPLSAFLTSGEPDILTSSIASSRRIGGPATLRYLHSLATGVLMETNPKVGVLLDDPFAIPLLSSRKATSLYEGATEERVSQGRNVHIGPVVRHYATERDKMTKFLSAVTPFAPTILSDLMTLSSYGAAMKIKKMFTLTRTLVSSAKGRVDLESLVKKAGIAESEGAFMRFLVARAARECRFEELARSSYHLAERLRGYWGKPVIGVSVIHPFDSLPNPGNRQKGGVEVVVASSVKDLTKRGPYRPYLGGLTKEHTVGKEYEVKEGPSVGDLKKLAVIATSAGYQDEIRDFMNLVCRSRCDYDLDEIRLVLPTVDGGALAHRYREIGSKGAVRPLGNLRVAEHVAFNTDRIPGVSGGEIDYPLVFQMFFCTGIEWARSFSRIEVSNGSKRRFTLPVDVTYVEPLQEPEFALDETFTWLPNLASCPGNPLVHIDDLQVKREKVLARVQEIPFPLEVDLRVLSGSLFTILLRKRVVTTRLEEAENAVRYDELDEALFYAVGAETIYQASVVAGAHLLAYRYIMTSSAPVDRHKPTALSLRVASIISELTYSGTLREGRRHPGSWAHYMTEAAPGRNGSREGRKRFEQMLGSDILNMSLSQAFAFPEVDLVLPNMGDAVSDIDSVCAQISRILWICNARCPQTTMGEIRKEFQRCRKLMREAHQLAVLGSVFLEYSARLRAILFFNHDILGDEALPIDSMFDRPMQGVAASAEDCLRRARKWSRVVIEPIPRLRERYLPGDNVRVPVRVGTELRVSAGMVAVRAPETQLPDRDLFMRRARQSFAPYSTVGSLWYPILKAEAKGIASSVVLGTGSGAIQRVLASLGCASEGLDLEAAIPPDVLREGRGAPPDCVGVPGAVYSNVVFETTGDALDPSVLQAAITPLTRLVVADLELSAQTPSVEMITALSKIGYDGRLLVKVLGSLTSVLGLVSRLWSAQSDVRLYQLGPGSIHEGHDSYVVGLNMVGSSDPFQSYSPSVEVAATYAPPTQAARPMFAPDLGEQLDYLSRGLIRNATTVIEAAHAVIESLDDLRGRYRGEFHGDEIMDRAEWVAALCWLVEEYDGPDSLRTLSEKIDDLYNGPGPKTIETISAWNMPGIHVQVDRPGMRYILMTVIPRLAFHWSTYGPIL